MPANGERLVAYLWAQVGCQIVWAERIWLEEFVFVAFARQVVQWRASRWQHVSLENLPQCGSWSLDMTQDMIETGKLISVDFHGCAWGVVDPGNGLPYKKPMRIASTVDLSILGR